MSFNNKYEYMQEISIDELLICVVCKYPLDDPVSTQCRHTFCRQCIERWLQVAQSCPHCRKPLQNKDLTPVTEEIIVQMLSRLKVKCKECGQTNLERGNFNDHIDKTCVNSTVACPSAVINCSWKGQRDQLNDHLVSCVFEPLRRKLDNLTEQNRQLQGKVQQHETNTQSSGRDEPMRANQSRTPLDATNTTQMNTTGRMLQSQNERHHTSTEYNFAQIRRKELRCQQEEQDRRIAQRQQEEQDRRLAEEYTMLEIRNEQQRLESAARTENNTPLYQRISQNFPKKQLDCGGRACSECGKCCDWRYDGPRDYWHKIRNWANWTLDDWVVYMYDDWKRGWNRRFEGTCLNHYLGCGAHEYVFCRGTDDDIARARRRYPQYFDKKKDLKNVSFIRGYDRQICVCDG